MTRFFFDTAALIRFASGAPEWEPFRDARVITERGHIYELARHFLKTGDARRARTLLAALRAERIEPTDEDLVEAAKLHARSSRLSAQDALGYVVARRAGLTFLTTDAAFRGMPGTVVVTNG